MLHIKDTNTFSSKEKEYCKQKTQIQQESSLVEKIGQPHEVEDFNERENGDKQGNICICIYSSYHCMSQKVTF